ncbi:MAG: ATP-binding protein [Patescibacteria group bacterium]
MTIYSIIAGSFNGLIALILAVYIFAKNFRSRLNQIFGLFYSFIAIWSFNYALFNVSIYQNDPIKTISGQRWAAFGYIPIAVLFYHFVLVFTGQLAQKKKLLIFGYLFVFFYIWLGVVPNPYSSYFLTGVSPRWYMNFWVDTGVAYYPYIIIWLFYAVYGIYLLFRHYKHSVGLRKLQCRYVFWGMMIGFIGGCTGYLPFFPYLKTIPPFGVILVSACIFGAAYAIARYRLMDIRFALGKTLVYFLTYATIVLAGLSAFYLGDFFFKQWFFLLFFRLVFFILLFVWFPGLSKFFEKLGGKYFYYTAYQARKTFSELGSELAKILNFEQLEKVVSQSISRAFNVKTVRFLLMEEIQKNHPLLAQYFFKTQQSLVAEEILFLSNQDSRNKEFLVQTREQMLQDNIEICLPLFFQQKLIGLIFVGEKANNEAYSQEEIDLLTQFSYNIAIVLQNTQLYGQLEYLTQNLQKKVDEQTAEIRKSYEVEKKAHDELKKLDIAKDQFILIAQHHLRTPLTIMKGFLSVVLKSKNKFEPKVIGYVEKISASTNRLAQIVNEFLDIAQFQAGRGLLKIKEIDFYGLIKEITEELSLEMKKKKLFLKVVPRAEDWPLIPADREKLKPALFNIIDNAIKYTKEGGITIVLEKNNSKIILSVQDTGIGLEPEEINHLFSEVFERGEEAKKTFPTGRGIGLYVTSSIVNAHEGRIWAESDGRNKGSKFCLELPSAIK